MSILVTFADGHSTLVVDRAAADQIVAYWPQLKATVRDLDQEERDREEMIGLLLRLENAPRSYGELTGPSNSRVIPPEAETELIDSILSLETTYWYGDMRALLRRLGRLP